MRTIALVALPLLALTAGCQSLGEVPTERLGSATLRFANGLPAGTAQFYGNGSQVDVTIALAGFESGEKGVHLHMTGSCTAPDFTSAGGHLNPSGNEHGNENPSGAHLGDLPNVTIGAQGAGTVSATLSMPREAALAAIYDADGTAVVVHAGPDDYRSDPAGNAGSRIACGVFSR